MSPIDSGRMAERKARLASLDQEIIDLVRERGAVVEQLRTLRRLAGLREFQLADENEVLSRYQEALGRPGTSIALELLALARAERAGAVRSEPAPQMARAAA
ncbi:chorismate mutase [Streptomyces sp. XD-27]|uniref:chorismate mutase n=1 Tax=Streptomyces sp. XD-27 TaxID=3062779 RepID=UPI0026F41CF7|nr:chorismate mutase [Streptomyces sp. XD-27]WKX69491.1 chorismate mutase [Streptomyces sp. XD-27]